MAKFVMECPNCGNHVEGKTGFFARKKIDCSCGYTIDVKTESMISRECPHCGNTVIFDQRKGVDAKCPICAHEINSVYEQSKMEQFACAQCGATLMTAKGASRYTCPLCDFDNDVAQRVLSEKIRGDGLASIIKYEGDNNTLIWKHPIEDFNYGSQLIVHESQEAIFFKDGQALDLFGPGRHTLVTQQLPLLEKLYQLPTDTEGTFHSEVYFINKTVQMSMKWGTPDKVRFIDPLTGVPLEIGASGEMNLQVGNSRKLLLKLVGTTHGIAWDEREGFSKSLQNAFRPMIISAVKTNLSATIKEEAIDLLEIDEKLDLLSEKLREKINAGFEEYGLTIPQFYVTSVVLPENDPNFQRIRELHSITLQTRMFQAEATVKTAKAQSETVYRTAEEQSKAAIEAAHREAELQRQLTETEIAKMEAERKIIAAQAEAQAMRMSGLTQAEIMQAQGYSQKDVLQAEVQKAYAEGIGNMGSGAAAGGGSGSMLGDVMGLGVSMAAMGAIAPQIGNMMQGFAPANQGQTFGQNPAQPVAGAWDCSCGQKGVVGNFCNNCGAPKMVAPSANAWNCSCGQTGIVGNFCNNCGKKRGEE